MRSGLYIILCIAVCGACYLLYDDSIKKEERYLNDAQEYISSDLYGRYGKYGKIIEEIVVQRGSAIEKIRLYAYEDESSIKKIVRNGFFFRNKKAQATIIISHGFMCDKYDISFLRWLFPAHQFNVLIFDYRAHGEGIENQDCTFGRNEVHDLVAAVKFVRHHPKLQNHPIFVYGFSMGAVTAIEAQAKNDDLFDALILDCPFDSSESIIKRGLSNMKFSFVGYEFDVPGKSYLEKYAFHPYVQSLVKMALKTVAGMNATDIKTKLYPLYPVESIKKIEKPCLFIHCKNDERVAKNAVESVYQGANGHKRLWITNGRRHYDSFFYNPNKYTKVVRDFLDKVLNGKIYTEKKDIVIEDKGDEII